MKIGADPAPTWSLESPESRSIPGEPKPSGTKSEMGYGERAQFPSIPKIEGPVNKQPSPRRDALPLSLSSAWIIPAHLSALLLCASEGSPARESTVEQRKKRGQGCGPASLRQSNSVFTLRQK